MKISYKGITINGSNFESKTSLCEKCLHPACHDYATLSCSDFTPALSFKTPLIGFNNELFNTFRIGKSWSKRLVRGAMVAITDCKTGDVIHYAIATGIYVGEKEEMLEKHGRFNHSILALNISDNIAFVLSERLKRTYGKMIYNSTGYLTAIYLKVIG